mmetsp:Transcript_3382/g.4584  ORF Transcript_3382/g.4584 Transcript_3382/m.4584 type:complete len:377 (+) Transcript_3382:163-1293(+)
MLVYSIGSVWESITSLAHIQGSVLFHSRTFPQAIVGAIIAIIATPQHEYLRKHVIREIGTYFSALFTVLGFLLVFRVSLAYLRFWEARNYLMDLCSTLDDLTLHTINFIRVGDDMERNIEKFIWKCHMGDLLVAFIAFVIVELRQEDMRKDFDELVEQYGLSFTPMEKDTLRFTYPRIFKLEVMIQNMWVRASTSGLLAVAPPIQSRTIFVVSEASDACMGALKIQTTPFPFPLMQVQAMMLHVFLLSGPVVFAAALGNIYLAPMVVFFSILCAFSLTRLCEELEDPFGTDPNDLPLTHYLDNFKSSVKTLLYFKLYNHTKWKPVWEAMTKSPEALQAIKAKFPEADIDRLVNAEQWKPSKVNKLLSRNGEIYQAD